MLFHTESFFILILLIAITALIFILHKKNSRKNSFLENISSDEIEDYYLEKKELDFQKECEAELNIYIQTHDLDFSTAYYKLGEYFMENNGEEGKKKAFYFFKRSSEYQNIDAKYRLGVMFYEGLGVEINYKEAFHFFLEASEHPIHDKSYYYLAIMCKKGWGTYKNNRKSIYYASRSPIIDETLIYEEDRIIAFNQNKLNEENARKNKMHYKKPKKTTSQMYSAHPLDIQDEFLSKWIEIEKILKTSNKNIVLDQIDEYFNLKVISNNLRDDLHQLRKRRNEFIHNKNEVEKINDDDVFLVTKTLNQLKTSTNL